MCLEDLVSHAGTHHPHPPWQSLPDTPLTSSTALAFRGALLAIGGGYLGNCAIYVYQPSTERWMEACAEGLPSRRSQCICAVLPNGDMYVTGGDPGIVVRVDIASLVLQ